MLGSMAKIIFFFIKQAVREALAEFLGVVLFGKRKAWPSCMRSRCAVCVSTCTARVKLFLEGWDGGKEEEGEGDDDGDDDDE